MLNNHLPWTVIVHIKQKATNPLDTGHKLTILNLFRRHSGRILNVLCTFNLRLVQGVRNNIPLFKIIRQRGLTFLEYYCAFLFHEFTCKMRPY